jgi:hypothetical protein
LSRKAKMTWPSAGRSAGGVTSRVFDPGTGWSLQEARELLAQGYSPAQVAKRTGYPEPMITIGTSPARGG